MEQSIENFLTVKEEESIVGAIKQAEQNTSGEIRVHIEYSCFENIQDRIIEIFSKLKMDNTKHRNAVLVYVAVKNKIFSIYGDQGINDVVENDFWNSTKNTIEAEFKKGFFAQGLTKGVLHIGEQLKKNFPRLNDDKNELSDSISKS